MTLTAREFSAYYLGYLGGKNDPLKVKKMFASMEVTKFSYNELIELMKEIGKANLLIADIYNKISNEKQDSQ